MDEYISKTKFEELMRKKARSNFDLYYADKSKHYHDRAIGYSLAADEAHDFPSADVQLVHHGQWIECCNELDKKCSCCCKVHGTIYEREPFCPNCGARMDLKEGDTE